MSNNIEHVKCLIIGSGPAGYTAATYAARALLNPILYKGVKIGGQLMETTEVENFPGFYEGIQGPDLMINLEKQAARFATEIRNGTITKVSFAQAQGDKHCLTVDSDTQLTAEAVIIATGASARWLGLQSEKKYSGRGVSACAVCDGFFFKNKTVAVVGGGDTAAEEAIYLSKLCKQVYLVVRSNHMRASKTMQIRVQNTQNIQILYNHHTKEILGDEKVVTGALLYNTKTKEEKLLEMNGFFVAIGREPNAQIFEQLEKDCNGFIITKDKSTQTNIPGVFACGDVQDPHYKQAVIAAGSGCMAALEAERYLSALN